MNVKTLYVDDEITIKIPNCPCGYFHTDDCCGWGNYVCLQGEYATFRLVENKTPNQGPFTLELVKVKGKVEGSPYFWEKEENL